MRRVRSGLAESAEEDAAIVEDVDYFLGVD
jgi:hypothetical protein